MSDPCELLWAYVLKDDQARVRKRLGARAKASAKASLPGYNCNRVSKEHFTTSVLRKAWFFPSVRALGIAVSKSTEWCRGALGAS